MLATDLLTWGAAAHIAADFLLQNEWMALNKTDLRHPAAWVHSSIHTLLMLLVFPPLAALAIGLLHFLIDSRGPVRWWMRVAKGMPSGPEFDRLFFWMDQSFHLITIAAVALATAWVTGR